MATRFVDVIREISAMGNIRTGEQPVRASLPVSAAHAALTETGLEVALVGDVVETRKLATPREVRGTGGTITVLSHDDLRLGLLVVGHLTVLLGTVEEQDDVGVLFE